jgi:hypothetical protein
MLERQVRHSFNSAIASRVTSPQDLRQLFLQPQRALNPASDLWIARFARSYMIRSRVNSGVIRHDHPRLVRRPAVPGHLPDTDPGHTYTAAKERPHAASPSP